MSLALAGDLVRQLTAVLAKIESRSRSLEAQQVARAIPIHRFQANAVEGEDAFLLRLETTDGLLYDFVLPKPSGSALRRQIERAEQTASGTAQRH